MKRSFMLSASALALFAFFFVSPANADGPIVGPPGGGGGKGGVAHGHGSGAGPAVVGCIMSGAVVTIFGAIAQGNDGADPRDMTGNEASKKAASGCPIFAPLALFYPPDNAGTVQIARLTNMWRKTKQGQMMTQLCGPGQGCSNGMDVFWAEEQYAYEHGHVRARFVREMRAKGIIVTMQMAKAAQKPLGKKSTKHP